MEHLSFLFFSFFPPFLVLKKNHVDAEGTHIIRSEVPPLVTLSWYFTDGTGSLPGLTHQPRVACGARAMAAILVFLGACLLPAEEAAVPSTAASTSTHMSRWPGSHAPRVAPESPPPHPKLPKLQAPSEMCRADSDRKRREKFCLKSCLALPPV